MGLTVAVLLTALSVFSCMILLALAGRQKGRATQTAASVQAGPRGDMDAAGLAQLRRSGSIVEKPHAMEFFLYFSTRGDAEAASRDLNEDGFTTVVQHDEEDSDWLCFATKSVVPTLSALHSIRVRFDAIAARFGGRYDGWGTEIQT